VEFEAPLPVHGKAFELVEQGESLLHDVAELAQTFDVGAPLREITGRIRRCRSARRTAFES
jgi:hypothetical protein